MGKLSKWSSAAFFFIIMAALVLIISFYFDITGRDSGAVTSAQCSCILAVFALVCGYLSMKEKDKKVVAKVAVSDKKEEKAKEKSEESANALLTENDKVKTETAKVIETVTEEMQTKE